MNGKLYAVAAACALLGCSKGGDKARAVPRLGIGVAVSSGRASDLRLSPDGAWAAFLVDGQKPHLDGIPVNMLVGKLRAARVDRSGERDLGEGITNVPGGFLFSRDSRRLAFLGNYNPASQLGVLFVADLGDAKGKPEKIADGVSYVAFSPDSKWVAFVAGGTLRAGAVAGGPYVEVLGEVALADFAPSSQYLLAKRKNAAGGALLKVDAGNWQAPKKLADQVGDFQISPDSAHVALGVRSARVPGAYDLYVASAPQFTIEHAADSVGAFTFSADSKFLARIEGQPPGPDQLGNLYVGLSDGKAGRLVAKKAHEFTFSPDSMQIAFIAGYREQNRAGTLSVAALPAGTPTQLGDLVPNFVWSPDSKAVAFLQRFLRPIFSVDLMLYRLGDAAAVKVQPGAYGYGFTPDGKRLLYRTSCIRDGRACDLYARELSAPLTADDAGVLEVKGKKLASGVYGFFRSAEKGERVLVTYARIDSQLYDVGVVNLTTGQNKTVEEHTLLPPAFASEDGTKVVYTVAERARPGLYVAEQVP